MGILLNAELISVGTELLLGQVVDTNAVTISEALAGAGVNLYFRQTVGDNWTRMASAISTALVRSDLVITTGGLGPTQDDLTKEVIAAVVGEPLEERAEAMAHIEAYFQRTGRPMSDNNRRQAQFPRSADIVPNPVGTAPGLWWTRERRHIIALPGVPREMRAMLDASVLPRLMREHGSGRLYSRTLRFAGIGESRVEDIVADLMTAQSNPTIAPYAGPGEVRLRLTARAAGEAEAQSLIEPVEQAIRSRLGDHLYGTGDTTLEAEVGSRLRATGTTLAVAESCTGGLIGHRLTNVPGSSSYLIESVVTYANRSKTDRLGVPAALIEREGAVSGATARAMAEGVRTGAQADFGLAVTGIAGPGGGSAEKPVGLVYVGVAGPQGTGVEALRLKGNRETIKERAASAALYALWRALIELG